MWKLLLCLVLVGVFFWTPQVEVSANETEDYADITVTAQGYVGQAPSGLIITYISDYELGIEWVKAPGANMTVVRASYGRPLRDRTDGFEVYCGDGNTTTLWTSNVGLVGPIYIGAWSQSGSGIWEEIGTSGGANFMSISFLFGILVMLGLVLFIAAFRWKDMLLSYAAALTWMAIGFWWVIGDITNFGLSETWSQILVVVPFILSFSVLLRLMNTEIVMESKGQRWTEWGATPREDKPNRQVEYRKLLRERMNK